MSLELLQVIKPTGEYVEKMEPEISKDELRRLYRTMVLARSLDIRGLQLQRSGRIGFFIGGLGQEAAHIGSAYALNPEDWVFPAYREIGSMLVRGITLKQLLNQYFANTRRMFRKGASSRTYSVSNPSITFPAQRPSPRRSRTLLVRRSLPSLGATRL